MMVTRGGTVKRIRLDALYTARKVGIRALSLEDGDELIAVLKTNGSDNILLATRQAWPSASPRRTSVPWAATRPACAASALPGMMKWSMPIFWKAVQTILLSIKKKMWL